MKDSHTSPSALNTHSAGSPEEDRSGPARELIIPVRIELGRDDLAVLERVAVLLEERRADDARAVRRAKWIAAMSVVSALLSLLILVLLAMGRWT
jgi:hypothetical protein